MSCDCKIEEETSKYKNKKNQSPGLCSQCKKGKHWRNECKSKFHKDGTPLKDEETKKWAEDHAFWPEIWKGLKRETEKGTSKLNPLDPEFNIISLPRATPGSTELDLVVNKDYILSLYEGMQLVDTCFRTIGRRTTEIRIYWRI